MNLCHRLSLLSFLLFAACDDVPAVAPGDGVESGTDAVVDADDVRDAGPDDVWPDGYWVPDNVDQLYGHWNNDDGTTVRALQFEPFDIYDADMLNITPVYWLYEYPTGAKPILVERGRATLAPGPLLHLETIWSATVTDKGKKIDLTFLPAAPDTFAIATGTSGARVFGKVW